MHIYKVLVVLTDQVCFCFPYKN